MISCTEFIAAYSEMCNYLATRGGHPAVVAYWQGIVRSRMGRLKGTNPARGRPGLPGGGALRLRRLETGL